MELSFRCVLDYSNSPFTVLKAKLVFPLISSLKANWSSLLLMRLGVFFVNHMLLASPHFKLFPHPQTKTNKKYIPQKTKHGILDTGNYQNVSPFQTDLKH